ncbi:HepT-like ribonuclease domain-containing protein [Desulfomicrobium baculatum]|uniref:DUF86 domain-containing protein n=1 Tax=Desulfomicrobium baculatum (strain DSM 4028 / VKM B-1378 / X) TaxID=525897 RepID=C7LTU5_DESBD|nr:DUF86 domain-containing protein [Desulfomicrobium baculatum]ACU89568.1 protein of unknown function DUF86 [Desulfomicrobium baculatum DSM 4028]
MDRDRAYIFDITEAARLALSYVDDLTLKDFLLDTRCQDAVIRRIEVNGEAARRVSSQTRELHPEIPWAAMIGMRNLMIHDYDDVDMDIVWDTVHRDLPELLALLDPLAPESKG